MIKPNIIILNSDFSDIPYTDVIDKISEMPEEDNKCNLILNVKNPYDKIKLENVSVIYKIFEYPPDIIKARETIKSLKIRYEIPNITAPEVNHLLIMLGINIYSKGAQYITSAIFKCYYHPEYFFTMDNIFKLVGNEYSVSKNEIKNSVRHTVDTLNNYYNNDKNSLYFKIFGQTKNLTSKDFLELFVDYLHIIKSKN